MTNLWISVRNWRKFQHYDPSKRAPIFVKNYTELMHDDAYMNLTPHDALILHRLWLEYASTRCRLHADTRSLSRRLNARVTTATLERLNHAGFIDLVASKTLADGYQSASPEVEVEEEKEEKPLTFNGSRENPREPTVDELELLAGYDPNGEPAGLTELRATIAAAKHTVPDDDTPF